MKRAAIVAIAGLVIAGAIVGAVWLLRPAVASAPFDFRSTNTVKMMAADGSQSFDLQDGGSLFVAVSGGYTWQMLRYPATNPDKTAHTWGFFEMSWYTPDPGPDGVVYREIWWPGPAEFALDNKLTAASMSAAWDVEVRIWKDTPPWERPGDDDGPPAPDEVAIQPLVISCDWAGVGTTYRQLLIDKVTGGGYFEVKRRHALVRSATWTADITLDGKPLPAGTLTESTAQLTKMNGGAAQRIPAAP